MPKRTTSHKRVNAKSGGDGSMPPAPVKGKQAEVPGPKGDWPPPQSANRIEVTEQDGEPAVLLKFHGDNSLGSQNRDFLEGLGKQVMTATTKAGELNEGEANFVLSVIEGIEPQDQVESMLAAQMAAVHMATMTFARRLANVDCIEQQDSAERAFNKLTRTFAAQVEALKRYRTGGQQTVTVEHVTVNEGGQAIVGPVTHGEGVGSYCQKLTGR